MKSIAISEVATEEWSSPGKRYQQRCQGISLALGRDPKSADEKDRHPFDLELVTLPPGASNCPYHSHSAQWEMYVFLEGEGTVRSADGRKKFRPGETVLFAPGEPHEIINETAADLRYYCIADDPVGESCYYPDSDKWAVRSGEKSAIIKGAEVDYLHGEEPPSA